jgi:hypothetical protein
LSLRAAVVELVETGRAVSTTLAKTECGAKYLYLCKKGNYIMTSIELKKMLIHQISEINDISFLKAIKTILDSKKESELIVLTPEQRNEIIESKKEVEQGLYIEQELLDKEVSRWLGTK